MNQKNHPGDCVKRTWASLALAGMLGGMVCTGVSLPVWAIELERQEASPTTQPAQAPTTRSVQELQEEAPATERLFVGRDDEYDDEIKQFGISGEQEQRIRAAVQKRNAMLREFVYGPQGRKLLEMRENVRQDRIKNKGANVAELKAQEQPLADAYMKVRRDGRTLVLQEFSEEQVDAIAGGGLASRALRLVGPMKLEEAQLKHAERICTEMAADKVSKATMAEDPFFSDLQDMAEAAAGRIRAEVLTDEQRDLLARRAARDAERAARAATRQSAPDASTSVTPPTTGPSAP